MTSDTTSGRSLRSFHELIQNVVIKTEPEMVPHSFAVTYLPAANSTNSASTSSREPPSPYFLSQAEERSFLPMSSNYLSTNLSAHHLDLDPTVFLPPSYYSHSSSTDTDSIADGLWTPYMDQFNAEQASDSDRDSSSSARGQGNTSKSVAMPRHVDIEFHRKLQDFVKHRKSVITRPLTDWEMPQLFTTDTAINNTENYGETATMEHFNKLVPPDGEKEFYENVRCGDLIIGEVVDETIDGLTVDLLCYDGGKRGDIEELRIQEYCSSDEMIPSNPNDLRQAYVVKDKVRCEVLKVNVEERMLALGMKGKRVSAKVKIAFPLGLISENEEMFQQRPTSVKTGEGERTGGNTYDEILRKSQLFRNPGNIESLGRFMGIFSSNHSLMTGLGHSYPKNKMWDELRKTQNLKLAETYEKLGKKYFRLGNLKEAFNYVGKAIKYDSKNVNYLVLRGALYIVEGNFRMAMEDLENALSTKPVKISTKQLIAESFITVGKGLQDKGHLEEAITSYTHCLSILPGCGECHDALNTLMTLQSHMDALETSSVLGVMSTRFAELREKLKDLLSDEIPKSCTGHYDSNYEAGNNPFIGFDNIEQGLTDVTVSTKSTIKLKDDNKTHIPSYSPSTCSSSDSSESESACNSEDFLLSLEQKRSKNAFLTECENIEEKVNAFLAKCDKGRPVPNLNSDGSVKKSVERVQLPSTIQLMLDKYGNYSPKGLKTFQEQAEEIKLNKELTQPLVAVVQPLVRTQNAFTTQDFEYRNKSYSRSPSYTRRSSRRSPSTTPEPRRRRGRLSRSSSRSSCNSRSRSRWKLRDRFSMRHRRNPYHRSRSSSLESRRKQPSSSRSRSRPTSSCSSWSRSRPSGSFKAYSHSKYRHHSRSSTPESRKRLRLSRSRSRSVSKRETKRKSDTPREILSPTDVNYVSPNYLGKRPIQGYHLLPPDEFEATRLARRYPVSFQVKAKSTGKKIQKSEMFRPSSSSSGSASED